MKNRIIKYVLVMFAVVSAVCACGSNAFGNREDGVLMQLDAGSSMAAEEISSAEKTQAAADTAAAQSGTAAPEGGMQIYVYICGAVKNPGVYNVPQGSRLYEAVELAGGFTEDADETCLNLARQAQDGEQLVIRTKEEQAALQQEQTAQGAASGGLVNINTATAAELSTISGIGGARAQAIIDYREKNGSFGTIEDIKKVDGIKDGLFSKIKDKITV